MRNLSFEVCIVGGGPAGAATALRLAALGHRVCVVERSVFPRRHVGESLTPGIWPVLDVLGLRKSVLESEAITPDQALVRWAKLQTEALTARQRSGWLLVERGKFDALLLRACSAAGVQILQPGQIRRAVQGDRNWLVEAATEGDSYAISAAYLVDATGRAGFLRGTRKPTSPGSMAIWGHLESTSLALATLVEALDDCWCWGAKIPGGKFSAMVFVDPTLAQPLRRADLETLWRSKLAGSELFKGLSHLPLAGHLMARDAACYHATDPIGASYVRVGEANYTLDPLSSAGVEKAMQNGCLAATAVHTLINKPDRAELCIRFYRDRQRETVMVHSDWASEFYGQVQRYAESPFWRARSASFDRPAAQPMSALVDPENLSSCSLETCVQMSRDTRLIEEPCILDNQICSQQALVHPNMRRPVAFLEDVAISQLLELVASSADLGSLLANWSSLVSPYKARQIAAWLLKNRILEPASG